MGGRLRVLAVLGAVVLSAAGVAITALPAGAGTGGVRTARACAAPTRAHAFACLAERRKDVMARRAMSPHTPPPGYGPGDLRSAYNLPGSGAAGTVVAVVDAYNHPNAEADLGVYRAQYGLPACTTGNGCFQKVNQTGAASPLPSNDAGWAEEISLDLDMVSAICPACHILLVEAASALGSDLYTAEDYAAAHATFVSNSWGGDEYSGQTADDVHFNHPGVAITVSAGDSGNGAEYPASSAYVTAVGGTSLTRDGSDRGWNETVWGGSGSGCSAYDAKPGWQPTVAGCASRAEADVSAVADPATGVAVYVSYVPTGDSAGWAVFGGTSAAAPIIASVYALAGTPDPSAYPAAFPYAHPSNLYDVTAGSNGTCGDGTCVAGTGWDGPTGMGTPDGVAAFTAGTGAVSLTNPGSQTGTVGTALSLHLSASGGTGSYGWSATGLPAGLAINASTGVVSGTPTVAGSSTVMVTASSGGQSASASFGWTIAAPPVVCQGGQKLGNAGFESGRAAPWSSSRGVVSSTSKGERAHSGRWYAWLDGHGSRRTDTLRQTVTIPAACSHATLMFYLKITTHESTRSARDRLTVQVGGATIGAYSNMNRGGYARRTFDLSGWRGRTVTVGFTGTEDSRRATSFIIDDTALVVS